MPVGQYGSTAGINAGTLRTPQLQNYGDALAPMFNRFNKLEDIANKKKEIADTRAYNEAQTDKQNTFTRGMQDDRQAFQSGQTDKTITANKDAAKLKNTNDIARLGIVQGYNVANKGLDHRYKIQESGLNHDNRMEEISQQGANSRANTRLAARLRKKDEKDGNAVYTDFSSSLVRKGYSKDAFLADKKAVKDDFNKADSMIPLAALSNDKEIPQDIKDAITASNGKITKEVKAKLTKLAKDTIAAHPIETFGGVRKYMNNPEADKAKELASKYTNLTKGLDVAFSSVIKEQRAKTKNQYKAEITKLKTKYNDDPDRLDPVASKKNLENERIRLAGFLDKHPKSRTAKLRLNQLISEESKLNKSLNTQAKLTGGIYKNASKTKDTLKVDRKKYIETRLKKYIDDDGLSVKEAKAKAISEADAIY